MIDVALLGIIRRWHLRDQVPLREIARRLGISRNTVRRYLRSEITEPSYAERRASSALDKYSLQLSGWLKAETVKPRKQRRNLKQIHEDLKELGYEGSYDRVAAFARQWKAGQSDRVNSASKRTLSPHVAASSVTLRYPFGGCFVTITTGSIPAYQFCGSDSFKANCSDWTVACYKIKPFTSPGWIAERMTVVIPP